MIKVGVPLIFLILPSSYAIWNHSGMCSASMMVNGRVSAYMVSLYSGATCSLNAIQYMQLLTENINSSYALRGNESNITVNNIERNFIITYQKDALVTPSLHFVSYLHHTG